MTAMTLATAKQQGVASSGGRFLCVPDVMKTIGLGRSTIYRMVAAATLGAAEMGDVERHLWHAVGPI